MINKKIEDRNAAAWVRLKPLLESKKPGDYISAREIIDSTGFDDWQSFRERIRRFFRDKQIPFVAVPNDGYRLVLDNEHVQLSRKEDVKSTRHTLRRKAILDSTNVMKLNDAERRHHDFESQRANREAELKLRHALERKQQLGIVTRAERGALVEAGK